MKIPFFNNWTWTRWLRFIIGLTILVIALLKHDWVPGIFGFFFIYQSVMNIGCMGNTCSVPVKHKPLSTEIIYEEIK